MIRPLRRAHATVFVLLAAILPLLYVLALVLRPPEPTVDRVPTPTGSRTAAP